MEKEIEKLFNSAKSVKLSEIEKGDLKDRIILRMNQNPLPSRAYSTPKIFIWEFLAQKKYITFALVFFILTGGISFASEEALPGDFLYPIKTGFNERIVKSLGFSLESKAKKESDFVKKRLDEAQKLAVQGSLDEEKEKIIITLLEKHFAEIDSYVSILEKENNLNLAFGIHTRLENSLRSGETPSFSLSGHLDSREESRIDTLSSRISQKLEDVSIKIRSAEVTLERESERNIFSSAEESLIKAEKILENVRSLALKESQESISASFSSIEDSSQATSTDDYIKDMERKIKDGKVLLGTGLSKEALNLFNEAYSIGLQIELNLKESNKNQSERESFIETENETKIESITEFPDVGVVKGAKNNDEKVREGLRDSSDVSGTERTKIRIDSYLSL